MAHIPKIRELSLKQMLSLIVISILIVSIVISTTISYHRADNYLDNEFQRQINGTEEYLDSSTIYIYRGLKLWDSTYDRIMLELAQEVSQQYILANRSMSEVNISLIAGAVQSPYSGRVRIDIINASGIVEYSHGGELGLDFSKWGVFYHDLTNIRNGTIFVPDRVVNGFNTSAPLTKYGYFPTDDHRYIIEPAIEVGADQVPERRELSYLSLINRVNAHNEDLKIIQIYNSMSSRIFHSSDENVPVVYPWTREIVKKVLKEKDIEEVIDSQNNTIIRYRYLKVMEDESPSSKYMDLIAELVYSTGDIENRKHSNLLLHAVVAIIGSAFLIIVAYLLLSRITRPIQQMIDDIDKISAGNLTHPISSGNNSEMNKIAGAVNRMVNQINSNFHTIQASEARYISLFQSSSDPILILKGKKLITMNRAAITLFGVHEDEVGGRDIITLFGEVGQFIYMLFLRESTNKPGGYVEDTIQIPINDEEKYLNVRFTRVSVEDEEIYQVQIRDMSDQRRIYLAYAEREAMRSDFLQMQMILAVLPDPTFAIDIRGKVIIWNHAMEKITGLHAQDIIGKENFAYSKVIYGIARPMLVDVALHLDHDFSSLYSDIKRNDEIISANMWLNFREERRYVSVLAARFYDRHGNVAGALESIRDVTSLKDTEEALLLAHNKLSLLSSITRHDITNKVMIAKLNLYLLEEEYPGGDINGPISLIGRSLAAIEHFIAFTRTYQELGAHSLVWQDIGKVFSHAVREVDVGNVQVDIMVHNICVNADPLFEKVCYNLIENAIRHGENTTKIVVSSIETGGSIRLSVSDNGCGVPDAEKELIFERGYGKNTGYGLFLTREILSLSGITIIEEGKAGEGCRFNIDIPAGRFKIQDNGSDYP